LKICILGSGGYLGSALTQAAKDRQYQLQLISSRVNGIDPKTGLLPSSFEIEAGIDVVYYLAQSPHYRQVPEYAAHLLSVNCVAAIQVASAAARSGVKRFIYASTGNVYAPTFSPVAETDPVQRHDW
jgi:UDP-glucose 4-epimerase